MEYVYIFDYNSCNIFMTTVKHDDDVVNILKAKGFRIDECSYMVSEIPLFIKEL